MPTYKFHTQQHYWIHTWYSKNFIYCTTCLSSMAIKGRNLILLFFLCFVLLRSTCDSKGDTLVEGKQLRDGECLISANGAFTLGLFSVDASGKRYLGIWYTKYDDKKVWVANRDDPIPDSSGYLTIDDDDGRLIIIHSGGSKDLVSYYTQKASINSTSAILRDDGNLVLRENQNTSDGWGQVLWQSFDHPTDTLLPRPECRSSTPRHFSPKRGYAPNGFRFDDDMSIIDCQAKCWSECPCVAYASTNDDRTGCEIWSQEMQRLFRVEEYYDGQAREIYFLPSNQGNI